ncbi:hypothetical protein CCACVL1_26294 [Corchorus capsularis]|uniref:AB hydrolase-1 domain-containing protein n=1 Tax=Corchorus capsularis TaxID=210143 RepID=A0A1R3GFD0_COCAP|nr:hypothetical protein CCACVL1_26294 [Corchorus capsularis]
MSKKDEIQSHFVLVHGAFHGAWCWFKVATLLKEAGHKVTALDLAASGVHPKQLHEIHSTSDYVEPLMEFMASLPDNQRVILVGHSMGGLSIAEAMERFPHKISVATFATAIMPGPDSTPLEELKGLSAKMDGQYTFSNGPDNPPTSFLPSRHYLSSYLYHLSPPEDLMLATFLIRPVALNAIGMSSQKLSKEKYG